jgi:hypothetical protein
MLALTLVVLASSFPLPAVDGKALAVTDKQKSFRVPMGFEKVRAFYGEQMKGNANVALKLSGAPGQRVLALTNKNKSDTWRSATVTEKDTETVIDVVPVLRMDVVEVEGQAGPLVQFIIGRSPEVDKAVNGIDHTEQLRK